MNSVSNKGILIVSYVFPPQNGIGGRRWAKFAKFFRRSGVRFKVISGPIIEPKSNWTFDTEEYATDIISVNNDFLSVLKQIPSNLFQKFRYRLALMFAKVATKGNYYDPTITWDRTLIPKIESLIPHGYDTIIASGGPFSYLASLLDLKKIHPSLKLVADFRDPWANNDTAFGYSELPSNRLSYEIDQEMKVLKGFDAIVSVADLMTSYFMQRLPKDQQSKCHTIPNGFDPDESIKREHAERSTGQPITVSFIGTLYNKTFRHVEALVEALNGSSNDEYKFVFCGDMSSAASDLLRSKQNISIYPQLKRAKALEQLFKSSIGLLILTDDLTYSFSTKFCEYVQNKIPIWVISEDGTAPAYILENGIGYHSLPDSKSIDDGLKWWKQNLDSVNYDSFQSDEFDINTLTSKYIELINQIDDKRQN